MMLDALQRHVVLDEAHAVLIGRYGFNPRNCRREAEGSAVCAFEAKRRGFSIAV
jgi:hypothetical protein